MDEHDQGDGARPRGDAWQPHPVLSAALRVAIFTIPILAALAATIVLRGLLPTPATRTGWWAWWFVLLACALGVSLGTERIARRLLPLAMLLKLSMLFPDEAPSRFRVARHSGSVGQLRSELDTAGPDEAAGTRAGTVLSLVMALTAHDRKTRGHAERVRVFTDLLTEQMKLPDDARHRLRWAALLHDIGKLSVEPEILNKPGKLDAAEWETIHTHPAEGARLAEPLLPWLAPWGDAIVQHHERYDGAGYPAGLAGASISEAARIVSVADCYDTMTSARSYQRPKSTAAARRELVAGAGSQFDPVVVRAFLEISLPRLLWAVGPVSLLVHLPFLSYLQSVGQAGVASVAQTAAVGALAGVTAVGLLGTPTQAAADRAPGRSGVVVTHAGDGTSSSASPGHAGHTSTHPAHTTKGGGSSGGGSGTGGGSGGSGSGSGGSDGSSGGSSGGSGGGGGTTPPSVTPTPTPGTSVSQALDQIAALRSAVEGSSANEVVIADLLKRLDLMRDQLNGGGIADACGTGDQFVTRVQNDTKNHHDPLDPSLATEWIDRANAIEQTLSC